MRIDLQPAFVLHARPFRETSLLLDLFMRDHGRLRLVARGARSPRSRKLAQLQPFSLLVVSCQGRGELLTLTAAESAGPPHFLEGDALAGGFYFNELLVRFLQQEDPHPVLFEAYRDALLALAESGLQERTLRLFEKSLLAELGYGLPLKGTGEQSLPFHPERWYRFHPDEGLIHCEGPDAHGNVFSGQSLLSLAEGDLRDAESLQAAKRLMRLVLAALPGTGPLHSRRLLIRERKDS